MYPAHLFDLFPPHPREPAVFVAMSFAPQFTPRWRTVIEPAIGRVAINGTRLRAHRVDTSVRGDSIHTEIVRGVADSLLVLADITTIGYLGQQAVRNQNVMYEVGLAHAVRQPEEVLILRSDRDSLPFDVIGIRVLDYSPDENPARACDELVNRISGALQEADARRSIAVEKALNLLSGDGVECFLSAMEGLKHPEARTMGQVLGSAQTRRTIEQLLRLGLIQSVFPRVDSLPPEALLQGFATAFRYEATPLGHAVFLRIVDRMGATPEALELAGGDAERPAGADEGAERAPN